MKITINLATRPFTDVGPILKRFRIAMLVFALISGGLGYGIYALHNKAVAARARERGVDAQIAGINHERQGYEAMMRQPDNAQVLNEAQNLNEIFDQKAFSWTLAMEDLETVLPGGVQVTTLEPIREEKTGRITLKLRVIGPRDKAVLLVQNLEHSHHFLRPSIVGESSENTGGPGQPLEPISMSNKVNVDIAAEFNPATIAEVTPAENKKETNPESLAAPAAVTAHRAVTPGASGPGLRRPPLTGVAHPSAAGQPGMQPRPQPGVPLRPQPGMPLPPNAPRQQGTRYPQLPAPQPQTAPKPRPGGPQ